MYHQRSLSPSGSRQRSVQTVRRPPPRNAAPVSETLPLRRSVGSARPSSQRYTQPTRGCRFRMLIFFLEYAKVHVGLVHPPQRQLQSPVTNVTVVVGAEPNWHLPPCRNPSTPTHPPPTDSFLTPVPADLPVCACLPFFRSLPQSAPSGLLSPSLSPFPSLLSPLSYSVPFTSQWGTL